MIKKFSVDQLARMIDHTFVKAYATEEDMTNYVKKQNNIILGWLPLI